jgi:small basic protein
MMDKPLLFQSYVNLKKAIEVMERIPKLHTRYQTLAKLARLDQTLAGLRDDLDLCNEEDAKWKILNQ